MSAYLPHYANHNPLGICQILLGGAQDCRDGTYKAVLKMDKAGLASIHALINGQPLGLPATLHMLPAELHSLLLITPPVIATTAGAPLHTSLAT